MLDLLLKIIDDIESVENVLIFTEIISIILIVTCIIGLVYIMITPVYVNSFADEFLSKIRIQVINANKTRGKAKEISQEQGPVGAKSAKEYEKEYEEAISRIHNIICSVRATNVMLCSINGENLSLNPIKRALEFLGSKLTETSTGIIIGEKKGSFFADSFSGKKMHVRAMLAGNNRVEIIFETSLWIGFSSHDCREAEALLKPILSNTSNQ